MANSFFIYQDTENVIKVICGALIGSKQENVRELFIRRADFISDLSVTNKHCDYLLHALFVTLVCDKCADLLGKMSPESVKNLKEAVIAAKSYACPDKAAAVRLNEECFRKISSKLSPYDATCNNIERYSAIIASHVADFWDDAVAELDKWLNAIEEYQHNALVANLSKENASKGVKKVKTGVKKTKKAKVSFGVKNKGKIKMKQDKTLLSVQELADKLGMSVAQMKRRKDYCVKKYPESKAVMESYFIKQGNMKYFRAEYFDEFAKLLGGVKKYKPRAIKATKIVDVPVVGAKEGAEIKAKLAEVMVKDGAKTYSVGNMIPTKPTELTGIIGLQKMLEALLKSYQDACAELDVANKEYDAVWGDANNCKNPQERTKLLTLVQQANDRVVHCMSIVENKKDEYEQASDLLKQAQEDEEAARKANQKWESTLAMVDAYINFVTECTTNQK